jgi:hypothetical protein
MHLNTWSIVSGTKTKNNKLIEWTFRDDIAISAIGLGTSDTQLDHLDMPKCSKEIW